MATPGFQSIDTIFFDLGFTLINFEGDFFGVMGESYQELASALIRNGCRLDPVVFTKRFQEVISQYYVTREIDLVERPVEGYLKHVLSEFGITEISGEIIRSSLSEMYRVTQAYWHLEADTISTLENLQKMGVKLGLITNAANPEDANHLIDRNGLRTYFKTILISACEGIRKPDPRIFNRGLENMGALPENSAMVGDTLRADIKGAQKVGMKGIWINRRARERAGDVTADHIKPDLVIGTLAELPHHLHKKNPRL